MGNFIHQHRKELVRCCTENNLGVDLVAEIEGSVRFFFLDGGTQIFEVLVVNGAMCYFGPPSPFHACSSKNNYV